jgi:hypothetical protein
MGKLVTEKVGYDLCFEGINFTSGLLALAALKAGSKVKFILSKPIETAFRPELTFIYPYNRTKSWQSYLDYRFMLKCSSLFPNLFFPQRVLTFNKHHDINLKFNSLFDGLLGHDRESATLPVNTSRYNEYASITGGLAKGSLVFEYRFDRNRAIIELLKLCKKEGALIVNDNNGVEANYSFHSQTFDQQVFSSPIDGFQWPYRNSFRVDTETFIATFQPFENQTLFQLYRHDQNTEPNALNLRDLFKKLGIVNQEELVDNALQFYMNKRENKREQLINDFTFNQIRNGISAALRKISTHSCQKIKVGSLFKNHIDQRMTFDYFRSFQARCDAKFDIAKQTGIAYQQFIKLFYRYPSNIDTMIDVAYEMLEQTRDAQIIWQTVEDNFLKSEQDEIFRP